jgi:hypothetical protein
MKINNTRKIYHFRGGMINNIRTDDEIKDISNKVKTTYDRSLDFSKTLIKKLKLMNINEELIKKLDEQLKDLNISIETIDENIDTNTENYGKIQNAINTTMETIINATSGDNNKIIKLKANKESKPIVFAEIINTDKTVEIVEQLILNLEKQQSDIINQLNNSVNTTKVTIDEVIKKNQLQKKTNEDTINKILQTTETINKLNALFVTVISMSDSIAVSNQDGRSKKDKITDYINDLIQNKLICSNGDSRDYKKGVKCDENLFESPLNVDSDYYMIGKIKEDNQLLSFDDQKEIIDNINIPIFDFKIPIEESLKAQIKKGGATKMHRRKEVIKGGSNQNKEVLEDSTIKMVNANVDLVELNRILGGQLAKLKELITPFKQSIMKFNLMYIHLYHHILFTKSYIQKILLEMPVMYKYLSQGIITYYLNIIKEVEKAITARTEIGKFFYKNFYFNILVVKNFLVSLNQKSIWLWQSAYDDALKLIKEPKDNKAITKQLKEYNITSKLNLETLASQEPAYANAIFIFNAFKDVLDEFQLSQANKVGVYLRINDWTELSKEQTVFEAGTNEFGENILNLDSLNKCPKLIGKNEDDKEMKNTSEVASKVKFKQIFDPDNFTKNDILANYMSLPNFLSKGQSIMLITYGYSGVGKTYTIFGAASTNSDGVLQTSLKQLNSQGKKMYYRAYEIYGRAFPYKSYWEKDPWDYAHYINSFTMEGDIKNVSIKNEKIEPTPTKRRTGDFKPEDDKMTSFINKIDSNPLNSDSTFKELTPEILSKFETIVGKIDGKREAIGTIRRTINNRVSSRSIMIYDFKIVLKEDSDSSKNEYVNFVVMDLPGKENIYETFVNTPSADQYECIKVKDMSDIELSKMTKAMAFMNPLSLMLNSNYSKIVSDKRDQLINLLDVKTQLKNGVDDVGLTNDVQFASPSGKDPNGVLNVEVMKNIIMGNQFTLLNDIYKEIFEVDKNSVDKKGCSINIADCDILCSIVEEHLLTPFEGYYINENIIGLLSSILNNLFLPNIIDKQNEIYMTLGNKVWKESYKGNQTELKMQTYFFRNLLRNQGVLSENGEKNIIDMTTYNEDAPTQTTIDKKQIKTYKDWIEETYDYNKAYKRNKPPINEILKPYFKQIKNIYVFYVVSNQNSKKCDKQIKLISDSRDFLDVLDMYTKAEEDQFNIILDEMKEKSKEDIKEFLKQNCSIDKYRNYKNSQFIKFLELLEK